MSQDWNHEKAMEDRRNRVERRFWETQPIKIDTSSAPMESEHVKEIELVWRKIQ